MLQFDKYKYASYGKEKSYKLSYNYVKNTMSERMEMDESPPARKKLKICFIDMEHTQMGKDDSTMWFTPHSTFYGYDFDKDIETRVKERFGWSTDLEKLINSHSVELTIHIISYNFLQKQGIVEKFHSKHGREFDDYYSYLECMNVLAVKGNSEKQLKETAKNLIKLVEKKTSVPIAVDIPRVVLLVPEIIHSSYWISSLKQQPHFSICSDIRDFIHDFEYDDFIDLSLSRGYKYQLKDYLKLFNLILGNP